MNTSFQKGDIIVFKAEDDFLSKAIAWFTQTDASHAAMVYSENSIVELGASGAAVHKVDLTQGEEVYVMRLKDKLSSEPLIEAADAYLKSGVSYDFIALFLLSGLLIYRRITPTTKLLSITNRILDAAVLGLDKLLHQSDSYMVCSQFIYQIYYDCGGDYRIQIVNGCITGDISSNGPGLPSTDMPGPSPSGSGNSSLCLYDIVKMQDAEIEEKTPSKKRNRAKDTDTLLPYTPHFQGEARAADSLIQELYTVLCESEAEQNMSPACEDNYHTEFALSKLLASEFITKLNTLLKAAGSDLYPSSLFITPGDLVFHAANLKQVDILHIKRVH